MPISAQISKDTELARAFADNAVKLIKEIGVQPALRIFSHPSSPYRQGDIYVYVLDKRGFIRAHPLSDVLGVNILDTKDPKGIPFIREMIVRAEEEPTGFWLNYTWLRPSDGELWEKLVWVRPLGDLIVAAGAYHKKYQPVE